MTLLEPEVEKRLRQEFLDELEYQEKLARIIFTLREGTPTQKEKLVEAIGATEWGRRQALVMPLTAEGIALLLEGGP